MGIGWLQGCNEYDLIKLEIWNVQLAAEVDSWHEKQQLVVVSWNAIAVVMSVRSPVAQWRSFSRRNHLGETSGKQYKMQTPKLSEILEQSERPKFIRGLRLEEISGVDHPAHEVEGWTVMKAKQMGRIGSWQGFVGDYAVVAKSVNKELRYTQGLLYAASNPGEAIADAHGESITATDLQKAQWDYVKTGDRSIHLQHGGTEHGLIKIGEWVDIVTWPYAVEAEFQLPGNKMTTKTTIPANSVWVGIEWNDVGWPLVKAGQLRGLSLGGFRKKTQKAKETSMAKQEKPIQDPIEGFTYKPFNKAQHDDFPDSQNTPEQPHGSTETPAEPGAQFKFPQANPKLIDHKPRLDRRFKEFLAGLEDGLDPDRYRAMLEAIAAFNDRFLQVTDQAGHIASLKLLASDLRKIMASENDVVKILRMGRFVAAEELEDLNTWQSPAERIRGGAGIIPGIGKALMRNIRRVQNQNALSSFDPDAEDDPIGMLAEKRKHRHDKKDD